MSKDIRSYFSVQSTKKRNQDSENKKVNDSCTSSHRKRRAVIESDSDDDVLVVKQQKKISTPDKKKSKVEKKTVNAADVFGSTTVKRTNRKSDSRVSEFHDDADFDRVLEALDESEWVGMDDNKDHQHPDPEPSKSQPKDISASSSKSPSKLSSVSSMVSSHSNSSTSQMQLNLTSDARHKTASSPSKKLCVKKGDGLQDMDKQKEPKLELDSVQVQKTVKRVKQNEDEISSVKRLKDDKKLDSTHQVLKNCKVENIDKEPSQGKERLETKIPQSSPSVMWVDKYKPSSIKQIIGQQGEKSNVKKLLQWLSSWHSNHASGVSKKLVRPSPWAKDDSGAFFKAALLSGPPGVGKTTTAHLVCKELGMDVVEFNASDTRSKKSMSDEVAELLSSKSLLPYFQSGGEGKTSAKHVLVMDEVDGMAGNEDRGGVAELISLIKGAKCPVICMCNDRNHPKIRSLAGHCFDLRFYKPRVEQIRGAMMSVCFKEKVQISPQALDDVISGTNCDIRQILNNLSMWSATEKKLNADQVKADADSAKKNIKLGPWDAVRKIFSSEDHKNMSLMDKSDLFFHDYNIMPLFVQENYLIVSPHAAKKRTDVLHHIARAATSISYGDLIEKTIRSSNSWSLLPVQSIFSSVVPGQWMEGHFSGQIQFPSWFGKNSRGSKMSRLLQDLQVHMRLSISGGKQAVNLNYIEPILTAIIHPLVAHSSQGVPRTLEVMQDYFVTRDDLDSLLELCRWPGKTDLMSAVDSKVKAALTRAYNKAGGVMTPYALDASFKKKKKGSSDVYADDLGEDGEDGSDDEDDDDSGDNEIADGMIKAKKNEKKDQPGTSASSSQSGSRGRGRGQGGGRSRGRGKK